MDVAASEFFKGGKYDLDFKNKDSKPEDWITSDELCEMYKGFVRDAPVVSIEDPFDQDDWDGWTKVTNTPKIFCHWKHILRRAPLLTRCLLNRCS